MTMEIHTCHINPINLSYDPYNAEFIEEIQGKFRINYIPTLHTYTLPMCIHTNIHKYIYTHNTETSMLTYMQTDTYIFTVGVYVCIYACM